MKSHQLQGQVTCFKNLDVAATQKLDPATQKLKLGKRVNSGPDILTEAAKALYL